MVMFALVRTVTILKSQGKVQQLQERIRAQQQELSTAAVLNCHLGQCKMTSVSSCDLM